MFRPRSIAIALFISIMLTEVGVVLVLALLFRLSLGEGFNDYVAKLELMRLDRVETVLLKRYQHHDGSWDFVRSPRDLQPDGPPGERRPPPELRPPQEDGQGLPPPSAASQDRLSIGPRLALFDARGQLLMGPPQAAPRPKRPLLLNGVVVGYLGLAPVHEEGGGLTQQFLASQTRNLAAIAVLAVLLSAIVAILLARYFRSPIAALAEAARQLAAGRLDTRVSLDRQDELGALAEDFNGMAARLERFEQSRRQWVADTSHELRTPLTILRAHTDAMRDGVMPLDIRGLDRLDSAVTDLDRLVADLYQLARADVGMYDFRREAVPLAELFDELVARFTEPLRKAGLTLETFPPPAAALEADPDRLRQLFGNLLGNAMRYTDPGGKVRISAKANGPLVDIMVEDSAPGVPDAALTHLFERFYRVDVSRSRRGGGSGLGLSICQAIAEGHGGRIVASHSALGGLRITLTLPLAQPRGSKR
jgi:two-component system sensor histidine kinase BaeS